MPEQIRRLCDLKPSVTYIYIYTDTASADHFFLFLVQFLQKSGPVKVVPCGMLGAGGVGKSALTIQV